MRRKFKKNTNNQKIRNATANEVDGIKFRSKLEAYTYKILTENNIPFEYENVKFYLLPKFEYPVQSYESHKSKGKKVFGEVTPKIRPITYLPDFVNQEDKWIIEVKGFSNDVFPIKWKMFKHKLMSEETPYTLYKPSNQKEVREMVELILKNHYHE